MSLDNEITDLREIFRDLLDLHVDHQYHRRMVKTLNKLVNSTKLESDMFITMSLLPAYASGRVNEYVEEEIEKRFKITLSDETKLDIYTKINNICRLFLK